MKIENYMRKNNSLFRDVKLGKHVCCCRETVSLFFAVCTQNLIMSKKGKGKMNGNGGGWVVVLDRMFCSLYKVFNVFVCIKFLVGLIGLEY